MLLAGCAPLGKSWAGAYTAPQRVLPVEAFEVGVPGHIVPSLRMKGPLPVSSSASNLKSELGANFSGSASPLAIVGACLFWLWLDAAVFSPTLCVGYGNPQTYAFAFLVATASSIVAFALLLARVSGETTLSVRRRNIACASGIVGTFGSFTVIGACTLSSTALLAVGEAFVGVSFAVSTLAWGFVCVAQGHHRAVLHIAGAWALALPFNLLLAALPPLVSGVVVALLPLCSAGVYAALWVLQNKGRYRVKQEAFNKVEVLDPRQTVLGFDRRLLLLILAFCTIFGLMYAWSVFPASLGADSSNVQVVGVRGFTALVFFVASLTVLRDRVKTMFKACFYILVVGLVAMVVGLFIPGFYPVSSWLVAVGYCGFDVLVWTMIAFHGYVSPNAPLKSVAIAMLAEQVGIFVGALAGTLLSAAGLDVAVRTMAIMALNMLAIVALVSYTEYGSQLWSLLIKTSMASDKAFEPTNELASFAAEHQLTDREAEILSVFVEGRSMVYIAEKLFVSENTVKTHIRHIYTKLDVHNKQDLMDMVERWRAEKRD